MKIDASKLSHERFNHLAALLDQCDLDEDLQLIAPEMEKAGVASKPVVTAALKEEVSVSVEAGVAASTSVAAVAKKMVPVKETVVKASAATEVKSEVVKKRGRPPLGDARMSKAEYQRRWREKQKSSRS